MILAYMPEATTDSVPRLGVQPLGVTTGPDRGLCDVRWRLQNLTREPVQILEVWLPHSQFFAERRVFEPACVLAADGSQILRESVRYSTEPGSAVENAFLNLRIRYRGDLWRVLTRMRAVLVAAGSLRLTVEAISAHRVGFAGAPMEESS